MNTVRNDLLDGHFDMKFSTFIITAEYFQLSKALIKRGLQPSFSLEEAFEKYSARLAKIRTNLPSELDAYSLIMILQRYAENKFYPENGSGLLLESLFHNLNDCEGGTKEILAYLNDIYPDTKSGSNRGMIRTTNGKVIGHMQAYLYSGGTADRIVANQEGITVETTRVTSDSILPYSTGDRFPLEDFIYRYYPAVVEGTPFAKKLIPTEKPPTDRGNYREIVGTSNHPLKMGYEVSSTILTAQYYDLENIRTQKIQNEFIRSKVPLCDPMVDPLQVNFANVFSNFVAIDPKLRKNMMGHYLASMQYWDNEVMPQWQEPPFIITYDDLANTLLDKNAISAPFIRIDAETTISKDRLEAHTGLLKYLASANKPQEATRYITTGGQKCEKRVLLSTDLLTYLFSSPKTPGLFFLPELDDFPWTLLPEVILDDCLALTGVSSENESLNLLTSEAKKQDLSFRNILLQRAIGRDPTPHQNTQPITDRISALESLFSAEPFADLKTIFTNRHSEPGTHGDASVAESIAEAGRTGINGGLVHDLYDFTGAKNLLSATVQYAKREDLQLSLPRALSFINSIFHLLEDDESTTRMGIELLEQLSAQTVAEPIRIASIFIRAQSLGQSPAELSKHLFALMRNRVPFDSDLIFTLLNYGLQREDAIQLVRLRTDEILESISSLTPSATATSSSSLFINLFELIRSVHFFKDSPTQEFIASSLGKTLIADFSNDSSPDYSTIFNRLYTLAFLLEDTSLPSFHFKDGEFLGKYIRFAGRNSTGKAMPSLVKRTYQHDSFIHALTSIIEKQNRQIRSISTKTTPSDEDLITIKNIIGDGNVIAYILSQTDVSAMGFMPNQARSPSGGDQNGVEFWYLNNLHRNLARIDFPAIESGSGSNNTAPSPTERKESPYTNFAKDFYTDDRVRESLSLLAYFNPPVAEDRVLKFRKIKDIRSIKDLVNVKFTESSRKVTRQDMSLLTLTLNAANTPREIRDAWEKTLAVAGKHIDMDLDQKQKQYLFAPHYPYLTENNSGFIYSPEKVQDLHNADQWGGRNDILLSSYLHFKNITDPLPDWLLRAAWKRSAAEQKIIQRLEQNSFLPMILECESDQEELPKGLFNAKWKIRKPYGEDIFPATLLLLRLGYLDISPEGEFLQRNE